MALNLSVTDGRVLVMPGMKCDRADARLSLFLHGKTMDDALTTFVSAVREAGFIALEKRQGPTRLVLVGPPK